ncbi:plasmid pRiA4b ORF-3 family protein [Candidatus Neptunochlamydia vexilliferae]|nr:plasmid pRiA4b ORF-3 family protein [Candidatus Neptunochlamydia vexilliferae]
MPGKILKLKISLLRLNPLIWRRVLIDMAGDLEDLHRTIQLAMGWENCHLYSFRYGNQEFGCDEEGFSNERLAALSLREKDEILYEYDFGDCWEHKVKVEAILSKEKGVFYPKCLEGARACPPEDCGGVWGYEENLEIMCDKNHPEYEDTVQWMGKDFDPEHFDLKSVNRNLEGAFVRY